MDWAWAIDPMAIVVGGAVVARTVRQVDKKVSGFLRDWHGEPERPGVPARAGVMERLERTELSITDVSVRVDNLAEQMNRKEKP